MDLFGPSTYAILSGKYYAFIIIDDYYSYAWVFFLVNKDNVFDAIKSLAKRFKVKRLCYFWY